VLGHIRNDEVFFFVWNNDFVFDDEDIV
jgi:hypothetical protein